MRSGTLLSTVRCDRKRARAGRLKRGLLLAGLLLALPFGSWAQNATPIFQNSSPVLVPSACGNLPTDISSFLKVNDVDLTDIQTWFEQSEPNLGGTLSLAYSATGPVSAPIVGGTATPSGITYTPSAALSAIGGMESFTVGVDDGNGGIAYIVVQVNVVPGPTLTLGAIAPICAGSGTAVIPFSGLTNVGAGSHVFSYTGGAQIWPVPSTVTSVDFDVNGASGGVDNMTSASVPGKGGNVQGHLIVTPGDVLNIFVGGHGGTPTIAGATGGFNGGGNAFFYLFGTGGAGGGASDIRIGGTAAANRVVVAGGGGGTGYDASVSMAGGNGGGLIGGPGSNNFGGYHANGGSQLGGGNGSIYPGNIPGSNGLLALGGDGSTQGISGGGGGGYYGGGGGVWNGGAGGSSFANAVLTSSVVTTPGTNNGDGIVTISYSVPGTYNITWDATASAAGFLDVSGAPLPTSSISVDVPTTLSPTAATTYNGVLTISNGTCTSTTYPVQITIKPVPSVALPADQIVCNGDTTLAISFINGAISATSLVNKWVNSNSSIGLADSGIVDIATFTPINTTTAPAIANITVTPIADGCAGVPQTFHIIDNPIPSLMSTTSPSSICDSTMFTYLPTSATVGATFAWSRDVVAGIAASAFASTGDINEILDNTTPDSITVTYVETITANGCSSTANVNVVVNPQAVLSSTLNPAAICDSTMFSYTPATATTGATLSWSRAAVLGISNTAQTGSGDINEVLDNTADAPIAVTYVYSIDINGCTSSANVVVVVNPSPRLTGVTTVTPVCDNLPLIYNQTSTITGTSYRWGRPAVANITPATGNGGGNIFETLHNSTALPITVMYNDTLSAFGCMSVYHLSAVIKPSPTLTTTLTPAGICTNTTFAYSPACATPGTTMEWARDQVIGIANDSGRAFNNISEVLVDTLDVPVSVPYHYVLTAGGCVNTQIVTVVVNPSPKLSNPSTTVAICDSQVFNFIPTSVTAGPTFTWTRAYVAGIAQTASFGANNPNEQLINNTNVSVDAIYVYTITANGCTNTQNVTATVRPTPKLSSLTSRTACTGAPINYTPQSFTPGTTFTWSRAAVAGITPGTGFGSGNISETLTSSSSSPLAVVYLYALNIHGCVHRQNVIVTVNPGPATPSIAAGSPSSLCANTKYVTFGATTAPPAGVTYTWSASNATVWATGSTKQYALINFATPGTAVITLTATQAGTACASSSTSYSVNIGSDAGSTPTVIYYNGQFICQQANVDSYQWGYDDASTLSSNTFAGETNQNFAEFAPDAHKIYWVMTTYNGCTQKAYYKAPTGVEDLATDSGIKVYPNPAENFVNVEVSAAVSGNVQVDVFNLLGQKINTVTAEDHKARIDVAGLPAGCYIIDCLSDGVKIASARFIKN